MDSRMIQQIASTRVTEAHREAAEGRKARLAAGDDARKGWSFFNWLRRARPASEPTSAPASAPPARAPSAGSPFSGLPEPLEDGAAIAAEPITETAPAPRVAA